MKIRISKIVQDDVLMLQQLFLSVRKETFCWLDTSSYQLKDFNIQTNGEFILVAKCEDTVAGFISVWPPDSFVHHLYIRQEYRGLGVGTALLKEVTIRFTFTIKLKCLKKNKIAIDFYKRNRFKERESGIEEDGEFTVFEYSQS